MLDALSVYSKQLCNFLQFHKEPPSQETIPYGDNVPVKGYFHYSERNKVGSQPDFNIYLLRRLERALQAPKTSPRHYAAATRIKDVVDLPGVRLGFLID